MTTSPATLSATLLARVEAEPHRAIVRYLGAEGGVRDELTYAGLWTRAQAAAHVLAEHAAGGEPVILTARPEAAFLEWFFGCLLAGAVVVPMPPPTGRYRVERVAAAAADCGARLIIGRRGPSTAAALPGLGWIDPAAHQSNPAPQRLPVPGTGRIAALQYTSGSTSRPRGVILTDDCLLHNIEQIRRTFELTPQDEVLGWLPPHHDMGLIGSLLTPLLIGTGAIVLDPAHFARRPLHWLETMSRYHATVSGGPNAAFESVARALARTPVTDLSLDLSRWRVAFVGAEPVQRRTLARFAAAAGAHGFPSGSLRPCYGLAEATLLVSCAPCPPDDLAGDGAVPCGAPVADTDIRILDAAGEQAPQGVAGEVVVRGPGVAAGYWGAEQATAETFAAVVPGRVGRYLRTGDTGLLDPQGHFVPTGRVRDLLIVNGRNVYPADLELAALRALEPRTVGLAAAVALDRLDRFAVVVECDTADEAALRACYTAVAEAAEHPPELLATVRIGVLPRTTSGKIQRGRVRTSQLAGELPLIGTRSREQHTGSHLADLRARLAVTSAADRAELVGSYLTDRIGADDAGLTGLDSLERMALLADLAEVTGGPISHSRALAATSLADLTAAVLAAAPPEASPDPLPAAPAGPQPAGPAESAMYLLEQLAPGGTTLCASVSVDGCATEAIVAALERLVRRHEALRTGYTAEPDAIYRQVHQGTVTISETDGTDWSDEQVDRWQEQHTRIVFDLASPPAIQVGLLRRRSDRHLLVLCAAHAVADFPSFTVLCDELLRDLAGQPVDGEPVGYGDFLALQRRYLDSDAARADADYFERHLRHAPSRLLVCTGPGRGAGGECGEVDALLDGPTTALLTAFARAEQTTVFTVLVALYHALLAVCTGQREVTVGVPMTGRTDGRFAATVGLLMNQVPVVSRLADGSTLRDLVRAAHRAVLDGTDHQRLPLALIAERCGGGRRGPTALFETMLVYYRALPGQPRGFGGLALGLAEPVRLGGVTLCAAPARQQHDTMPLTALVAADGAGLRFRLRHLIDRVDTAQVEKLAAALPGLCARLLIDPDAPLLPPARRTRPIAETPGTDIVQRLHAVVERFPDQVAVRDARTSYTYREFWERTGRVASVLADGGVRPGDRVALLHERDADAVVATFAVLRAGAGYLHLSPDAPPARLRRLVTDCAPILLIADAAHRRVAGDLGVRTLALDPQAVPATRVPTCAALPGGGSATAYVSYTSGSSGQPKGVVVSHAAVLAATDAFADRVAIGPGDVIAGVSALGWDIVVGDLYGALLRAATLHVVPDEVAADGAALAAFLKAGQVTVMSTTPHRWRLVMDAGWRPDPGFRVVCGGDAMSPADAQRFRELGAHVWNFYGPTETVLWSSAAELWRWDGQGAVPIGHSLAGYTAHVLDSQLRPVGWGEPGELSIGGATVADGYLRDARLTAARFVPDPFAARPGSRMYRTGDSARQQGADGLVFLGRDDGQVKIRGYRVELAEVDAALALQPDVGESVVVALPDRDGLTELVAFVVARPGRPADSDALLRGLAAQLPRQLIPTRVLWLDRLPVNANGKLDRTALPALPASEARPAGRPAATPTEQLVAGIVADILGLGAVDADDDFFMLGLHSLRAIQLATRLSGHTGVRIPVATVFTHPAVADLAGRIDELCSPAEPPPGDERTGAGHSHVTPGQRRLWFDHVAGRSEDGMVLPFLIELRGRLDAAALRTAFQELVARHSALRTVLVARDGEPYAVEGPAAQLSIVDLPELDSEGLRAHGRQRCRQLLGEPWVLAQGPLARGEALLGAPDHAVLVFVVHHVIFDGWSARVLLNEFRQHYLAALAGVPASLPALPVDERAAGALVPAGPGGQAERQIVRSWVERVLAAPRLRLPTDVPAEVSAPGAARKRRLSLGDSAHRVARAAGTTAYAVVSAATQMALRRACGQDLLVTGLDLAGRERAELADLVGYFGNQLPLVVDLSGVDDLPSTIDRVRVALADAIDLPWLGYERLVDEVRRHGGRVDGGLFDVKIVHQYTVHSHGNAATDLAVSLVDSGWASAANPLAVWLWEDGDSAELELHHRIDACASGWADRLQDQIVALIMELANPNAERSTGQVEEFTADESGADLLSFDDIELAPLDAVPTLTGPRVQRRGGTGVLVVETGTAAAEWLRTEPDTWREGLREHGAVLLRGGGVDSPGAMAAAVAEVFAAPYATNEHPRKLLDENVVRPVEYPAELDLYWHNEDSFNHTYPATLAFACQRPADDGGETTVVDGMAVLAAMDPGVRGRFTDTGVCYVRRFLPGLGLPWTTVFGTTDRDEVAARCAAEGVEASWDGGFLTTRSTRPAVIHDRDGREVWFAQILHWHEYCLDEQTRRDLNSSLGGLLPRSVSYGDGAPIPDEMVAALIADSRAHEYAAPWRRGDLLLVDNTRAAHGRRSYRGERRIMVSLGDPRSQ